MSRIINMFKRLYMQFLAIVLIAVVFAYVLNALFLIGETHTRIMFTALFLMGFALVLMATEKVLS